MFSEKNDQKGKELLESKSTVSGCLKYSAVLMVKKSKGDKKYTSFKAF